MVMFYLVYSGGVGPSHETLVQVRAARIAAVVNGVLEARSLGEFDLHRQARQLRAGLRLLGQRPAPQGRRTAAAAFDGRRHRAGFAERLAAGDFAAQSRMATTATPSTSRWSNGQVLRFEVAPLRRPWQSRADADAVHARRHHFSHPVRLRLGGQMGHRAAVLDRLGRARLRASRRRRRGRRTRRERPDRGRAGRARPQRNAPARAHGWSTSAPACWSPSATTCARR